MSFRAAQTLLLTTVIACLFGCRDFEQDFQTYCENSGCGVEEVDAGQLIITADTVPARLVAGQCGIVNLRVRFENGSPPVERPQAEISFPPIPDRPQPSINKTNTCEEQISTVVIEEGRVTVPIFMRDTLSGSYEQPLQIYFPASDRTVVGTLPIEVAPATAVRIAMATSPTEGRIGACVGPFEAALYDAFGNVTTASSDLPLELTSNSATGAFFANRGTDNACADPFGDGEVKAGSSSRTFFFSDTAVGNRQLRASSTTLDGGSALAVLSLTTAPPSQVLVTSGPQDVVAATCSEPFTVEFSDAFGNRVPLETDGTLTFDGGTVRFYGDSSCTTELTAATVDAGATSATFHVQALTQSASETLVVGLPPLAPALHSMTVTSAGASRLEITPLGTQPYDAGSCNQIAISAKRIDGGAEFVNGVSVQLFGPSDNDGGFFIRQDNGCSGAPISSESFDAGTSTLLVNYRDTVAGVRSLRATAPLFVSGSADINIAPGPVSGVRFIDPPASVEAGVCTPLRIQAVDEFGNATARTSGITVAGASSLSSERISAVSNCATAGNAAFAPDASTTSLFWSAKQLGSSTFTLVAADGGVSGDSAIIDVVPGPPATLLVQPPNQTQQSLACGPAQYYVELRDRFGSVTQAPAKRDIALIVQSVQSAATCAKLSVNPGSTCGAENLNLQIPAGGTRANFKAVAYSQTSCTYTVTATSVGVGSTSVNIRLCRGLGAACANAGDCCSGTCSLTCK